MTFREHFYAACKAKKAELGRILTAQEVFDVGVSAYETMHAQDDQMSLPQGEPKPAPHIPLSRKRNALLDALVEACGGDPFQTGKMAFRTAATALKDIREVLPGKEETEVIDEIKARAERYRKEHPTWTLTPTALAKNWSTLGGGKRTHSEAADIYIEPRGWRPVLQNLYQLSDAGVMDKEWLDLSPDTRKSVLQRMAS